MHPVRGFLGPALVIPGPREYFQDKHTQEVNMPSKAATRKKTPTVVIFVEQLYNDLEFWVPYYRLKEAGAAVLIAGPAAGEPVKSKYGLPCTPDVSFDELNSKMVDGLVVPGGYAPDFIRRSKSAVDLVRKVCKAGKPVAFICHAGWVLASAGVLSGRRCTSTPAIMVDMVNAGAIWEDSALVVDDNLVSSRKPEDLPLFCAALVEKLGLK
jgi:protease I